MVRKITWRGAWGGCQVEAQRASHVPVSGNVAPVSVARGGAGVSRCSPHVDEPPGALSSVHRAQKASVCLRVCVHSSRSSSVRYGRASRAEQIPQIPVQMPHTTLRFIHALVLGLGKRCPQQPIFSKF